MTRPVFLTPKDRAVIEAARAYVREWENPAPDLLYRSRLREILRDAINVLDGRTPPDVPTEES